MDRRPISKCKYRFRPAAILVACIAAFLTTQCGFLSRSYHHSVYGSVTLTTHPDSLDVLRKGDFALAHSILEAKLKTNPLDPALNYYLGSVELFMSDDISDIATRRALRAQGWNRVEFASGKFYYADVLLAHGFLIGRWGRKRNGDLYGKHLRLSSDGYRSLGGMTNERLLKNTWVLLCPP